MLILAHDVTVTDPLFAIFANLVILVLAVIVLLKVIRFFRR